MNPILKHLKRDALRAQASCSESLLYLVYGRAQMAQQLGALTHEELIELKEMTIDFVATDLAYRQRRRRELLADPKARAAALANDTLALLGAE